MFPIAFCFDCSLTVLCSSLDASVRACDRPRVPAGIYRPSLAAIPHRCPCHTLCCHSLALCGISSFLATYHLLKDDDFRLGNKHAYQQDYFCDICAKAKSTKKPFSKGISIEAKVPGKQVFLDPCGPINPPTISGFRYFVPRRLHPRTSAYLLKRKQSCLRTSRQELISQRFSRQQTTVQYNCSALTDRALSAMHFSVSVAVFALWKANA